MAKSANPKYMDIKEFRELGFLQEANRQFFHPHGLALEVRINQDGTEWLGGIWDSRDDPEGIFFADGMIERDKIARVEDERERHRKARMAMFNDLTIQTPEN